MRELSDMSGPSRGSKLGGGVPRERKPRGKKAAASPDEVKPDDGKWASQPCVSGQFFVGNQHRAGTMKAEKFDMSDEEDVKLYNDLLERASVRDGNIKVQILHRERKFSEKTNDWLILVEYAEIEYLQIVPKGQKV